MSERQAPAGSTSEPGTTAAADAAGTAPARRSRGRQTVGDMVRSLALVLLLVGAVVALNLRDDPDQTVREIDFAPALDQARATAPYDVLAPVGLAPGWRPTSARSGRDDAAVTWHLGLVTPEGNFAEVEQSDGPAVPFVTRFVGDAQGAGRVDLGGSRWRRLEEGSPEPRALVRRTAGVTTVVAGNASWAELATLARSLRPAGNG